MSHLGTIPNVEDVFPGTDCSFETFKKLLSQLSRTDTLMWCFRINHILGEFKIAKADPQRQIAQLFFSEEEVKKIFDSSKTGQTNCLVVNKGAATLLARWACVLCEDKPNDGRTFENPEVRRTFAKVLLIANQYWLKNIKMERMLDDVPLEVGRVNMLCAFRQNAAGSESRVQPPINGIAKGYQMFIEPGYFKKYYPDFAKEFESVAQMSIDDYFTCLTYLTSGQTPDIKDGKKLFEMEQAITSVAENFRPTFRRFLELESQDVNEIAKSFWDDIDPSRITDPTDTPGLNDTPLRAKPLFRIHDGRMIVIDPILFHAKTVDGPLFTVLKSGKKDGKAFFGEFGKAFQDYTLDYLRKIYPQSSLYNLLQCPFNDDKGKEISDACLYYGDDLILIEIKASFLSQERIINNDNQKYVEALKERYVWDSKKREPKGVTQLANSIRNLVEGKVTASSIDAKNVKRIFPVLLVHDELIDAPLHSHFFHNQFIERLEPESTTSNHYLTKGNYLVAPLTLMTMEDLESMSFPILKKGVPLRRILAEYVQVSPDRLDSLNNFFGSANYTPYVCQILAKPGLDILAKTKERLFPGSKTPSSQTQS